MTFCPPNLWNGKRYNKSGRGGGLQKRYFSKEKLQTNPLKTVIILALISFGHLWPFLSQKIIRSRSTLVQVEVFYHHGNSKSYTSSVTIFHKVLFLWNPWENCMQIQLKLKKVFGPFLVPFHPFYLGTNNYWVIPFWTSLNKP